MGNVCGRRDEEVGLWVADDSQGDLVRLELPIALLRLNEQTELNADTIEAANIRANEFRATAAEVLQIQPERLGMRKKIILSEQHLNNIFHSADKGQKLQRAEFMQLLTQLKISEELQFDEDAQHTLFAEFDANQENNSLQLNESKAAVTTLSTERALFVQLQVLLNAQFKIIADRSKQDVEPPTVVFGAEPRDLMKVQFYIRAASSSCCDSNRAGSEAAELLQRLKSSGWAAEYRCDGHATLGDNYPLDSAPDAIPVKFVPVVPTMGLPGDKRASSTESSDTAQINVRASSPEHLRGSTWRDQIASESSRGAEAVITGGKITKMDELVRQRAAKPAAEPAAEPAAAPAAEPAAEPEAEPEAVQIVLPVKVAADELLFAAIAVLNTPSDWLSSEGPWRSEGIKGEGERLHSMLQPIVLQASTDSGDLFTMVFDCLKTELTENDLNMSSVASLVRYRLRLQREQNGPLITWESVKGVAPRAHDTQLSGFVLGARRRWKSNGHLWKPTRDRVSPAVHLAHRVTEGKQPWAMCGTDCKLTAAEENAPVVQLLLAHWAFVASRKEFNKMTPKALSTPVFFNLFGEVELSGNDVNKYKQDSANRAEVVEQLIKLYCVGYKYVGCAAIRAKFDSFRLNWTKFKTRENKRMKRRAAAAVAKQQEAKEIKTERAKQLAKFQFEGKMSVRKLMPAAASVACCGSKTMVLGSISTLYLQHALLADSEQVLQASRQSWIGASKSKLEMDTAHSSPLERAYRQLRLRNRPIRNSNINDSHWTVILLVCGTSDPQQRASR